MKISEPQPKMPKSKLVLFLLFLLVAFLIAILLVLRSFFGSAVFKDDVRLVFAYRQLNQDLQNVALVPHYSIPVIDGQKPVTEGRVPYNEVSINF